MTSQVVEAFIIIASNNPFRDYSTPTSTIRLLSLPIIYCHFGYLQRSYKIYDIWIRYMEKYGFHLVFIKMPD